MEFLRSAIPITNIRGKNIERQPVLDFKNNVCTACVAESEPPGAATFTAALEPEPIFLLVGSKKAAPAASFRQAKKKRLEIIINFLRAQNDKF